MSDTQRRRLLERDSSGKPTFRYVRADSTCIRATFERIRREQSKQVLRVVRKQEAA